MTLLDGGMGRLLSRMGAPFRLPEWSALALIEAPETVAAAHAAFRAAGADVLTANNYALTPHHLGRSRFNAEGGRLADLAGRLARQESGAARVAGSLPPLFGSYQPGRFDAAAAPAILSVLVEALAPHVDLWLAETLSAIAEMQAAARAVAGRTQPLWVSFTIEDALGGSGPPRLRSGETIAAAVAAAREAGAAAVLFNCSQAEAMLPAVREAAVLGVATGAYANAFVPEPPGDEPYPGISELRADLGPADYLDQAASWVGAGAAIVGGCCGIGPEHIARLRGWIDAR